MRKFKAMRIGKLVLLSACVLSATTPGVAYTHARRGPTSPKVTVKHSAKPKILGQRSIEDDRATQIQNALIHAGYLTGDPSGHWDDRTEAAMTKLQADNGWQTKLVPDSRALIKLGLGPASASNSEANQAEVTPTGAASATTPAVSSGTLAQR
jgi:Putative peptidoglycan binding domain